MTETGGADGPAVAFATRRQGGGVGSSDSRPRLSPIIAPRLADARESRRRRQGIASITGRESFRDVFLTDQLRDAIRRINLKDGQPWLDNERISRAVSALERINAQRLMEANQEATELLLGGVQVDGLPGWDGGRGQTIHIIDWPHPERNTFTAVNQFKVDCPGGQAKGSIRPDITLFINGIPVVVIECKSPTSSEPLAEVVDQLRRYHNARKHAGETEENEGSERLFYTNQFLIATSCDEARVGTINASARYYLEWKDTAPVPLADAQKELGKQQLSSQNKLRRFKIVVVTDRKDLERQLSDTATLTAETVERARGVREVKTLLSRKRPGMVFAMIQKYRDQEGLRSRLFMFLDDADIIEDFGRLDAVADRVMELAKANHHKLARSA